ncbi:unnamed protein product, partial [Protopolystoma xenopodis]
MFVFARTCTYVYASLVDSDDEGCEPDSFHDPLNCRQRKDGTLAWPTTHLRGLKPLVPEETSCLHYSRGAMAGPRSALSPPSASRSGHSSNNSHLHHTRHFHAGKGDDVSSVGEASGCICTWRLTFPQPAAQYLAFRQRLDTHFVSLENITITEEFDSSSDEARTTCDSPHSLSSALAAKYSSSVNHSPHQRPEHD